MAPPAVSSTITISSSLSAAGADVFAFLTATASSAASGCGRFAGTTSATGSLCCPLAWPLTSGAGVFFGLVGILTSPVETPLMGLSSRGSLLEEGQHC
jgi:hypothetical protein